ncbi:MAG TPA: hypothetical protein DCS93_08410 [Microscillaceae bacterium]|nr:hypothetical protein [Microscillaceae bacterium]
MTIYKIAPQFCWVKLWLCLISLGFISKAQTQNLALYKGTLTSSDYGPAYGGNRATDGIVSAASKWTSTNTSGPHWIYINLGSSQAVGTVTVKHAGAAGEPSYFNTQYYQVQYYSGGWVTAATVNNNAQQNITSSSVSFTAQYVRIYITDPGIDNIARIPEIEIYGSSSVVLSTSGDSHLAWPYGSSQINCSNRLAGTNGWYVTCSTGCGLHVNSDYYADDWVTSQGTFNQPFYSPLSGTVIYAGWSTAGYGYQVLVRSNQNGSFAFRIAHLETISVTDGQTVAAGTLLGYIGSTGNSTGAHAHTVLYRNLNQSAINALDNTGAYLSSSTYAAPFYFDAACNNTRRATSTKAQEKVTKEVILEGLRAIDKAQSLAVFPNPISSKAIARFTLPTDETVSLAIYDLIGTKVKTIIDGQTRQAGETNIEINSQGLKSGLYILKLKTPSIQKNIRFKVLK